MIRPIALLMTLSLLAGCGYVRESRVNPFNWFGQTKTVEKVVLPERAKDPRPLIAQVTSMTVEPIASGAIVRATGLPPTQGWWEANLVAADKVVDGKLVIEFLAFPPVTQADQGTPYSREITAATHISKIKLQEIREIIVQGENNALSSRR